MRTGVPFWKGIQVELSDEVCPRDHFVVHKSAVSGRHSNMLFYFYMLNRFGVSDVSVVGSVCSWRCELWKFEWVSCRTLYVVGGV